MRCLYYTVYRESKNMLPNIETLVHVFPKYWPIFQILLLAHSVENLQ